MLKPAEIESYVDAAAAALALRLAPQHRPGVLHYFTLASEYAALIDTVALTVANESAMHFSPVEPKEKAA